MSDDQRQPNAAIKADGWLACHECDLLLERPLLPEGHRLRCPRCGNVLVRAVRNAVEHCLALAIGGLVLFVPANLFPVLTLKLLGQSHHESLPHALWVLANSGQWLVATVVFLCTVLVPLLKLLLMLKVSWCLHFRLPVPGLARCFRWYQRLDSWGMLEVYMLGILISLVKLADLAEVVTGWGLYSFIGLLMLTVMMSACIDEETFWEAIERNNVRE